MARNLSRNTELYISTNDNTLVSADPTNLYEVKVLDGYSFSQDVSSVEIGVNEAGAQPVRGTLSFNTALNPVDVSFSTYVRPYTNTYDIEDTANADNADCVERVLWASAMGTDTSYGEVTSTGPASGKVITAQDGTQIDFGLATSNDNALMPVTLYFKLEKTTYVITDFNVSSAEVDFSIDGIATVNWSGQGSRVTESPSDHIILDAAGFTAGHGNDYLGVPTTQASSFLRNKLSVLTIKNNVTDTPYKATGTASIETAGVTANTITIAAGDSPALQTDQAAFLLVGDTLLGGRVFNADTSEYRTIVSITAEDTFTVDDNIEGEDAENATAPWNAADELIMYTASQHAGVVYDIPITGATVTLENNFTYLTPEELAIVNQPLAGFAGNRVISGSLTAYLNTGAEGSGGLLQDMLAKIEDSVTNNYQIIFKMGGASGRRVEFTLNSCQLTVPSTNVEDIISTEISFTSKPYTGSAGSEEGSFEATNEMLMSYFT